MKGDIHVPTLNQLSTQYESFLKEECRSYTCSLTERRLCHSLRHSPSVKYLKKTTQNVLLPSLKAQIETIYSGAHQVHAITLYSIIIIFDTVVRRKRNFKHEI